MVFIPFTLATTTVHRLPGAKSWPWPVKETSYLRDNAYHTLRDDDYRAVLSALLGDNSAKTLGNEFWDSLERTKRRQERFLLWYGMLAVGFGCFQGWLGRVYERTREREDLDQTPVANKPWILTIWKTIWRWVADNLIVRNVSKWPALLKPSSLGRKNTMVGAEILTIDGNLYHGTVSGHYVDADDELSGLILVESKRRKLTPAESSDLKNAQAVKSGLEPRKLTPAESSDPNSNLAMGSDWEPNSGWRKIPGAKLYFAADKIINLNLSHTPPLTDEIRRFVQAVLRRKVPAFKVSVQRWTSEFHHGSE